MNAANNTLQSRYAGLARDNYVAYNSISNIQALNNELQGKYNKLNDAKLNLDRDYAELQRQKDALQVQKDGLNATNTRLNSDYTLLQSQKDALQDQYNKLNAANTKLNSDYTLLQGQKDALQGQYNTLQSQKDTLNAANTKLNSDYLISQSQKTTAQSQYNTLYIANTKLNGDYIKLNSDYTALNAAKLKLDNDYKALQITDNALQLKYNSLSDELKIKQQNYNDLTAKYNTDIAALNATISNNATLISTLKGNIEDIQSQVKVLTEDLAKNTIALQNANATVASLQSSTVQDLITRCGSNDTCVDNIIAGVLVNIQGRSSEKILDAVVAAHAAKVAISGFGLITVDEMQALADVLKKTYTVQDINYRNLSTDLFNSISYSLSKIEDRELDARIRLNLGCDTKDKEGMIFALNNSSKFLKLEYIIPGYVVPNITNYNMIREGDMGPAIYNNILTGSRPQMESQFSSIEYKQLVAAISTLYPNPINYMNMLSKNMVNMLIGLCNQINTKDSILNIIKIAIVNSANEWENRKILNISQLYNLSNNMKRNGQGQMISMYLKKILSPIINPVAYAKEQQEANNSSGGVLKAAPVYTSEQLINMSLIANATNAPAVCSFIASNGRPGTAVLPAYLTDVTSINVYSNSVSMIGYTPQDATRPRIIEKGTGVLFDSSPPITCLVFKAVPKFSFKTGVSGNTVNSNYWMAVPVNDAYLLGNLESGRFLYANPFNNDTQQRISPNILIDLSYRWYPKYVDSTNIVFASANTSLRNNKCIQYNGFMGDCIGGMANGTGQSYNIPNMSSLMPNATAFNDIRAVQSSVSVLSPTGMPETLSIPAFVTNAAYILINTNVNVSILGLINNDASKPFYLRSGTGNVYNDKSNPITGLVFNTVEPFYIKSYGKLMSYVNGSNTFINDTVSKGLKGNAAWIAIPIGNNFLLGNIGAGLFLYANPYNNDTSYSISDSIFTDLSYQWKSKYNPETNTTSFVSADMNLHNNMCLQSNGRIAICSGIDKSDASQLYSFGMDGINWVGNVNF